MSGQRLAAIEAAANYMREHHDPEAECGWIAAGAIEAYERALGLTDEILDAQADLQTGLGFFRLEHGGTRHGDLIENRLARSLARTHRLLDRLGRPMYDPATHPDIPNTGPSD